MQSPTSPVLAGNRIAHVRRIVGDDYYDLKMPCGQLIEFQDRTGVGPHHAFMRLTDRDPLTKMVVGDFRMEWILEAVRLGLIGGGMNPIKALKLTDRYVRDGFIMDYVETAADVLWVSLYGPEDEPLTPDEEPEEEDTSGEPMAEVSPTPSPALSGLDSIVSVGPPAAQ